METEEFIEDGEGVTAYRARARNLLPQITQDVKRALDEASIEMDVFVVVPTCGDAIATFGTVTDPADEVWATVSDIVCSVVRKTVGLDRTKCRELACATTAGLPTLQEGAALG